MATSITSPKTGHVCTALLESAVQPLGNTIAVVDFASRNKLTLHSANHDLHTGLDAAQQAETREFKAREVLISSSSTHPKLLT
ncbi:MAG: hypothetical protein M3R69_02570 [Acidobacteriota bacterium]|nr:hypothetical protein [Acidobacteriota bacterium]